MYSVRYFPTPYLMTPIMLPKILRIVEGCICQKAVTSFAVKWRSCEIGFSVAGSGTSAGSTTLRLRASLATSLTVMPSQSTCLCQAVSLPISFLLPFVLACESSGAPLMRSQQNWPEVRSI